MSSFSFQNRWEIFANDENEQQEEEFEDSDITEQKTSFITSVDEQDNEAGTGTWIVDKHIRRRRRKNICLLDTLPANVTSLILAKVGALEVMPLLQQGVCQSWTKQSTEPKIYRRIDLRNHWKSPQSSKLFRMTKLAVDRSNGQIDEFSISDYPVKDLLNYVLDNSVSNSIKILRFVKCPWLTDDMLLEFARKFPSLEELELSYCRITSLEVIREVAQSCSKLKRFQFIANQYDFEGDIAFVIAKTMPKLCHLRLEHYQIITIEAVQAILEGCPHLNHLELRCWFIKCQDSVKLQRICEGRVQLKLRVHFGEDFTLRRCQDIDLKCCHQHCCCPNSFFLYDPDKETDVVEDNDTFLLTKATGYYL